MKQCRILLCRFLLVGLLTAFGCASDGGGSDSGFDSPQSVTNPDPSVAGPGSLSRCATKDLDYETTAQLGILFNNSSAFQRKVSAREAMPPIRVVFHVISKGSTYEDGHVPDSQIFEQIEVLNRIFSGQTGNIVTPFRYELAGINRVTNPDWFTMAPGSEAEVNAKTALHAGGANTLNLYTVNTEGGVLGYSTFPILYLALPQFDGVVINYRSLPGGSFDHYSTGKVAVHEVGHWLGLLHTFQGECDAIFNDLVQDTPAERLPAKGEFCPSARDSCPELEGSDPINNHMTYTDDDCRHGFTPGQLDLMQFNAITFRGLY